MKTEALFHYSTFPRLLKENDKIMVEQVAVRVAQKSDLKNHRFSFIDYKPVHDPTNWDSSWFTNYE